MKINKYNYVLWGLVLIILFADVVNASTTGTVVVDDYLNVRSSITGSSISKLTNGTVVTVLDLNAGSNSLCSNWYKIESGNTTGYACGNYISLLIGYASCVEDPTPVGVWKDMNKSSKLASVSCDKGMTILDKNAGSNSKCSNWYKVSYNGTVGYSCGAYVYFNKPIQTTSTYNRPWTSPMKAIVGGAEFIAENYIAKGQYTSYLKKFNVNPNSAYSTYNHQYMANLAAPSSEARSSYTSYKSNNLLSLPLHFVIPTYNDMPSYTALPGTSGDTSGQTNVSDSNFEIELNRQGFSESYKKKLRALHTKYPNWTFENMNTGLKFSNAVTSESKVCSISGNTNYYYKNSSGNYVSTESGWYLANEATVGYYLDPRNFLNDTGILQFESLRYSNNYTSNVVQSVINNTFMKGTSTKDNKSYADIFVEAGRTKNVSPVYLASLARQESGVNGSMATTGAQFTYKGITYVGLYNFFNIGAYSSEESPIRAGLVWASGGDSCTIVGNSCNSSSNTTTSNNNSSNNTTNNSNSNTSSSTNSNSSNNTSSNNNSSTSSNSTTATVTNRGSNYYVSNLGVRNNSGYVNGFSVGTTVSTIVNKLNGAKSVSVTNVNGKGISGATKIGTGSTIKVLDLDGKTSYNYHVVMYGDVNGDGQITASDYVVRKNYILKRKSLNGAILKGADSNKNGSVTASDYVVIKNYIMGKTNITQK